MTSLARFLCAAALAALFALPPIVPSAGASEEDAIVVTSPYEEGQGTGGFGLGCSGTGDVTGSILLEASGSCDEGVEFAAYVTLPRPARYVTFEYPLHVTAASLAGGGEVRVFGSYPFSFSHSVRTAVDLSGAQPGDVVTVRQTIGGEFSGKPALTIPAGTYYFRVTIRADTYGPWAGATTATSGSVAFAGNLPQIIVRPVPDGVTPDKPEELRDTGSYYSCSFGFEGCDTSPNGLPPDGCQADTDHESGSFFLSSASPGCWAQFRAHLTLPRPVEYVDMTYEVQIDGASIEGPAALFLKVYYGGLNQETYIPLDPLQTGTKISVQQHLTAPGGVQPWMVAWPQARFELRFNGSGRMSVSGALLEMHGTYGPVVPYPDFVVQGVSATPSTPTEGDQVTLAATVANLGDAAAPASTLLFELDEASLQTVAVPSLAVGASTTVAIQWTAVEGGGYYGHIVRATVDPANLVAEVSIGNNWDDIGFRVTHRNRAPDAVADSYSVDAGATLTVAAPGVLANDSDFEGDALSAQLATAPLHGTLSLQADGGFSYTPTPGFVGTDSFTYAASDGALASPSTQVSLTIDAPNLVAYIYGPDFITAGSPATLGAYTCNEGTAGAAPSTTRMSIDGAAFADSAVPLLAPGVCSMTNHSWTPATSGPHVIRLVADVAGVVVESDEGDNERVANVNAQSASPTPGVDLSPASQAQTIARRGTATYEVVVINTGTASDTMTLTKSANARGWKARLSSTSVTLAAGASTTVTLTVEAPNGSGTSPFAVTITGRSGHDSSVQDTSTATTSLA